MSHERWVFIDVAGMFAVDVDQAINKMIFKEYRDRIRALHDLEWRRPGDGARRSGRQAKAIGVFCIIDVFLTLQAEGGKRYRLAIAAHESNEIRSVAGAVPETIEIRQISGLSTSQYRRHHGYCQNGEPRARFSYGHTLSLQIS